MNAPDLSRAVWRKSTRSNGNVNCVEVAVATEAAAVRDSKNAGGSVLIFTTTGWTTFLHTRP